MPPRSTEVSRRAGESQEDAERRVAAEAAAAALAAAQAAAPPGGHPVQPEFAAPQADAGVVTADLFLQAVQTQSDAQTAALQTIITQQNDALRAHRDAADAAIANLNSEVTRRFQEAMQAHRDQARAEALVNQARLDAIQASLAATNNAQQQHADANTAALAAQAAAVHATGTAVAAGQGAMDAAAAAATTAANTLATQAAAPKTSIAVGSWPNPPNVDGISKLDTSESDHAKLAAATRILEQALRLRAKAFSSLLAHHAKNKALQLTVGPAGPPNFRFANTADRETFAAAVHDYIKELGPLMFAVNTTGAAWVCPPPVTAPFAGLAANVHFFTQTVADALELLETFVFTTLHDMQDDAGLCQGAPRSLRACATCSSAPYSNGRW